MISKSLDERHSYGPDKLIYGHFWPLNSKCDLDLADFDVILLHDTPSNDGEQMCQMILKSHNERHSYGPNKLIYGHFWPLNLKCDLDLGDIDVLLSHDTPSHDGEQMYQVILKSNNKWTSYGPDKHLIFELEVWPWPWRYRRNSFARNTVQWWWTNVPNDFNISQWRT